MSKITILTATYNRGEFLNRLYISILKNSNYGMDIEWIIIDDGSTDSTENIVRKRILENKIDIKYIFQENSGKMEAINKGVEIATGDFIIDCDSDDYFTEDAFKIIKKYKNKLIENPNLYALCFLKKKISGEISGNKFKKDFMISTMFELYFKGGITGEKILLFNGEIRKKYKHILEENEKFITEARMYHQIDEKYKIMCINEIIEIGNYIEDGYTKNMLRVYSENPKGYYKYFKEILQKDNKGVKLRKKLYIWKNLIKLNFLIKNKN